MDEIKELKAQGYDILAQMEHIRITQLDPLREQLSIVNKKIEELYSKLNLSKDIEPPKE